MDSRVRTAVAGVEAYVVGGAVRDELLGRQVVDIDVATPDPEVAARIYAGLSKGALFPLSERHGAWRVAFKDGTTVDFTPLARDDRGRPANAATSPSTRSPSRSPAASYVDPLGGRADLEARTLRAVSETIFEDDPLGSCAPSDSRTSSASPSTRRRRSSSAATQASSASPAGERILGELERLSPAGFERADELGLLEPLGGSLERLA